MAKPKMAKNKPILWSFLSFISVAPAFIAASAQACAVCITGTDNSAIGDAFNLSLLFLMAAPYVVVGSIAGWLFYAYWRAPKKRENLEAEQPPVRLAWHQKESGK
jgi:hypothetical protein